MAVPAPGLPGPAPGPAAGARAAVRPAGVARRRDEARRAHLGGVGTGPGRRASLARHPAGDDAVNGLLGLARTTVRVIRRAPLSLAFVAMVWAYGLATRSLPGGPNDHLMERVGTGVAALEAGRWWTPLSAMLWWGTIGAAALTSVLVLLGGALAEHRIGSNRTAALLVGTQVGGTLNALSVVGAG